MRAGKENTQLVICVILLFAMSFIYNMLSPYTTDDYAYMFSAVNGDRINRIFQILPSLWNDYLTVHGRVVPHFFLQLFLIGPKWIFNIVNAVIYVVLIWLMTTIADKKPKNQLLLWLAIAVTLWVFVPAYGQVFFWMSGSVNYSWCYVFALLYCNYYFDMLRNPYKKQSNKKFVCFCIFSFFFGAYSELVSFSVVFTCFLVLCVVMYEKKQIKQELKQMLPIIFSACGYLTMLLSPAQANRKGDLAIGAILKKLIVLFEEYYYYAKPLLVLWAILLVLAIHFKTNKKMIIMSTALLSISVVSIAMLSVASYAAERHYANAIVFLVAAIVVFLQILLKKEHANCIMQCICVYLIVSNLMPLWEGTYDIYTVHKLQKQREQYISEQIKLGNTKEIYVPLIQSATCYSCKYDLIDLQVSDIEIWPNTAVAKYYGIENIYGIE